MKVPKGRALCLIYPQGKAIQQTLNGMNFSNINEVRQGKFFEINGNIITEDLIKD